MKRAIEFVLTGFIALTFSILLHAETSKNSSVIVVLETTAGKIEIEVNTIKAPLSSASFLTAIDQHLFDNKAAFYRVVRKDNVQSFPVIEVIQGGVLDHSISLPLVPHETTRQTGLLHRDGTISLTRALGSSGSGTTFFICIGDQPSLDYGGERYEDRQGFAAFGQVIKGMEIVRAIQKMRTRRASAKNKRAQQMLVHPVKILKAFRQ